MAKFQIYTYMFRPVMENQLEIPFEEYLASNPGITILYPEQNFLTESPSQKV